MAKKKLNVPEKLNNLEQFTSMADFLDQFGKEGFSYTGTFVQFLKKDSGNFEATKCNHVEVTLLFLRRFESHTILFIDDDLNPWSFELEMDEDEASQLAAPWRIDLPLTISPIKVKIKNVKPVTKLMLGLSALQTSKEVIDLIKRKNHYGADFIVSTNMDPFIFCMAPQIEQLYKMGMAFAENMRYKSVTIEQYRDRFQKSEIDAFNRLTQRGTNPKTIFKTSKAVYSAMKDVTDLIVWDSVRKMAKNGKVNEDTIRMMVNTGYKEKEFSMVNLVLGKMYRGKPIFTMDSLINYLNRIDMNEAIGREEGLQLLLDYLRSCEVLDVEPKIDGDSLKREHDVMARNVRQYRDAVMAEKMAAKCDELQKYNYFESVFFARAISSYDDLIDEANQQHNCVASYARLIADGRTMIFVIRMKANPDRSYITLELDPKTFRIRQKYVAYNQPVRNRAASEFILRFQRHCVSVRNEGEGIAEPMVV